MRSDEELLAAWRAGDRKAGNALFQRHFERVRRFFVNKVGRETEDLVQRVFVGCVEGRERFEGRSTFRTFVLAVAHNVLREHFRQKRRDALVDLDERSAVDLGAGPSSLLAERREQRLLLEGLRRIPLSYQVALELYFWERLTGAELGEILGIPENTARSRVRRAKELLGAALRRIERSGDVLQSTTNDLEAWAASIRKGLGATPKDADEDVDADVPARGDAAAETRVCDTLGPGHGRGGRGVGTRGAGEPRPGEPDDPQARE